MNTVIQRGVTSKGVSLAEIFDFLNSLGLIVGDAKLPDLHIQRVRPTDSCGPGDLTFIVTPPQSRATEKLIERLAAAKPSCVLTGSVHDDLKVPQITTKHPFAAISAVAEKYFASPRPATGIHPSAAVSESAKIGARVSVGAFAVIGENVEIGDDSIIHPHVVIYAGVKLGKGCVIHAGAVIREHVTLGDDCLMQPGVVLGGDGFGYFPDPVVGHRRIPHVGTLILGDRVDFGANSAIDRATFGETVVGDATKVDNLVQVGHNVKIGKRSILCGQVGISGSAQIGNDVILGGQVGVGNQVIVADKTRVAAKGGITNSVDSPGDYAGFPLVPAAAFRRITAIVHQLPELVKRLRRVEQALLKNQAVDKEIIGE